MNDTALILLFNITWLLMLLFWIFAPGTNIQKKGTESEKDVEP